jgi:hypothetical protein
MSRHGTSTNTQHSSYNVATDENGADAPVQPCRLELSVRPEDGSLLTAPLMTVLLAATDGLYSDLYNMVQGEIDVTTAVLSSHQDDAANTDQSNNNEDENVSASVIGVQTKRERMAKLSFAERRHELAWRLASNGRSLQHVAALCAASASTYLAEITSVSSRALQHTRTAWVQADEAQDALYFFHAQLFPGRAAPHDVYGASDLICAGNWFDLPRDLLLMVDRYESSAESTWSRNETDERWQLAVRGKLLLGEVGWVKRNILLLHQKTANEIDHHLAMNVEDVKEPLWKVSINGGIVMLTHGKPKIVQSAVKNSSDTDATEQSSHASSRKIKYPIEAMLTLFPNQNPDLSEWTLLSIDIHVQAKTGEFNHQLEASNRQRYDLHRLAALAMSREESRVRREQNTTREDETMKEDRNSVIEFDHDKPTVTTSSFRDESAALNIPPARPLHSLFQVMHTFSLSWQLELLSAQAQALRRGVWSAAEGNLVQVTPVRFFEKSGKVLGVLSIFFWKVDDSFGPPSMGDLFLDGDSIQNDIHDDSQSMASSFTNVAARTTHGSSASQLRLSIRAEADVGMRVALSGGSHIMEEIQGGDSSDLRHNQLYATVRDLIENASNPFSLSASDALLAATKLCSELKCRAVVEALQPTNKGSEDRKFSLPAWIRLSVDRGSISVAARIRYHGVSIEENGNGNSTHTKLPIIFQLMCDARTGSFVATFPRSMHVLRKLAGNDVSNASEAMAIRISNLPENRRKAAGAQASSRMVRDAFDGLVRSMNLLGQRAGVGGSWDNIDEKSSHLRERAIHTACVDVEASLMKCCGMAAMYGLSPLAFGAATGIDAAPDM